MELLQEQNDLLRTIAGSIAHLAIGHLSDMERGSLVTLSLVLEALLDSDADCAVLLSVRSRFEGIPTGNDKLHLLYTSLLSAFDLACNYNNEEATKLASRLLTLSPRSFNSN